MSKLRKGSSGLHGAIREAIGVSPSEEVEVVSSPTTRELNYPKPASPPADRAAFEAMRDLPAHALQELGLRRWGETNEATLWLFPGEWYNEIPYGFEVVRIDGETEVWGPDYDDDIRFGCLAYGILGPE